MYFSAMSLPSYSAWITKRAFFWLNIPFHSHVSVLTYLISCRYLPIVARLTFIYATEINFFVDTILYDTICTFFLINSNKSLHFCTFMYCMSWFMTTFFFTVVAKNGFQLCGLNLSTSALISYHECSMKHPVFTVKKKWQ